MLLSEKEIKKLTLSEAIMYIDALHDYIHALHMQNMSRKDMCDVLESLYRISVNDKKESMQYQHCLNDLYEVENFIMDSHKNACKCDE